MQKRKEKEKEKNKISGSRCCKMLEYFRSVIKQSYQNYFLVLRSNYLGITKIVYI